MPKNIIIKTVKSSLSVSAYLNRIEPAQVRRDSKLLAKSVLVKPKMGGSTDRHAWL